MTNVVCVSEGVSNGPNLGASIADVFPPGSVAARFVVSMAMAQNDVELALRDILRAVKNDDPDLPYRVRVLTGHLVEAIDSLNAYSERSVEARAWVGRVSPEGQKRLKAVRGALQRAGSGALEHIRHNTFHYPSPKSDYDPTSDEQLEQVLGAMGGRRAELHVNWETRHVTHTFAHEVALALAIGKDAPSDEDVERRLAVARDGALAFRSWADELVLGYLDSTGVSFGEFEPR